MLLHLWVNDASQPNLLDIHLINNAIAPRCRKSVAVSRLDIHLINNAIAPCKSEHKEYQLYI